MILIDDYRRIGKLIAFMFVLMIYVNQTDGVAGHSGNKLSQNILFLTAPEVHSGVIPDFQIDLSQADVERAAKSRAMNAHEGVKIAWSAIHGKGTLAGANKPAKVKTPATPTAKPVVETDLTKAFGAIKTTVAFSNFSASLAHLTVKKG